MQLTLEGCASCRNLSIQYFLVTESEPDGQRKYGICVRCGEDVETVSGLTASLRRVQELLNLLMRGVVTPVTVMDIVEDWKKENSSCLSEGDSKKTY